MNWDVIAGRWGQMTADIKGKWARLTDDDISAVGAQKDKLVAILQERYGLLKDDATREVDGWTSSFRR